MNDNEESEFQHLNILVLLLSISNRIIRENKSQRFPRQKIIDLLSVIKVNSNRTEEYILASLVKRKRARK